MCRLVPLLALLLGAPPRECMLKARAELAPGSGQTLVFDVTNAGAADCRIALVADPETNPNVIEVRAQRITDMKRLDHSPSIADLPARDVVIPAGAHRTRRFDLASEFPELERTLSASPVIISWSYSPISARGERMQPEFGVLYLPG